jgi:cell division protein FtsQ
VSTATSARRGRHDPWKTWFFVVAAVALVAGVAWALLGSSLFVVRSIQVSGLHLPGGLAVQGSWAAQGGSAPLSSQGVRKAAGIKLGTPLVRVDTRVVARRVARLTWVQSARVHTSWPDSVVITAVLRKPTFVVRTSHDFAVLDSYGVVLRRTDSSGAGLVHLKNLKGGPLDTFRRDAAVLAAGAVVREMPRWLRHRVISVRVGGVARVALHLTHGVTVVWGDRTREAAKAEEVGVLLRTSARYIDVSDPGSVTTGEPVVARLGR